MDLPAERLDGLQPSRARHCSESVGLGGDRALEPLVECVAHAHLDEDAEPRERHACRGQEGERYSEAQRPSSGEPASHGISAVSR